MCTATSLQMAKLAKDTSSRFFSQGLTRLCAARVRRDANEKDEVTQPVKMTRHKQACMDLEKAAQITIQILEDEARKNEELCVLIGHQKEWEQEKGHWRLTEQTESGQRLKLEADEEQKPPENEVSQRIDPMRHKQACQDLEKATQLIIQVLQQEAGRNQELCVLICEIQEREAEARWSLAEQVEANKQLQLKIDRLQKHLEEKHSSLTQANQQMVDLHSPLRAAPDVLSKVSPLVPPDACKLGPLVSSDTRNLGQMVSSDACNLSPVVSPHGHAWPVCPRIKDEEEGGDDDDDDDGHRGEDDQFGERINPQTEHALLSESEIKAEYVISEDGSTERIVSSAAPTETEFIEVPEELLLSNMPPVFAPEKHPPSTANQIQQRARAGERPYPCSHCGKSFTREQHLKRHERIHTGERPYRCAQCGKGFTQGGSLKEHERIHSGEATHRCPECGRGFISQSRLKKHQVTHTGERPYHCTQCGKSFTREAHLKRHQHVHAGEDPPLQSVRQDVRPQGLFETTSGYPFGRESPLGMDIEDRL